MKKDNKDAIAEELGGIALDTVREVRHNKFLIPLTLGVLCIAAAIFFVTSILPLIKQANEFGQAAGSSSGTIAGAAVGSAEGVTNGIKNGKEDGQKKGLSPSDTVVEIANTIKSDIVGLGRLEVLVANVDLTTYHETGKTYGALYLIRGSAVFTVDLNKVSVTYSEDENLISVVLPQPEAEITIDPREMQLLAEWQGKYFNGTDEQGYLAGLALIEAIDSISESRVVNYPELLALASASAKSQIEAIGNAARGDKSIQVNVSME